MENKMSGVYAAMLTLFNEDGEVCEKRIRKHVKFLISKGLHGLYICGGTGEGLLMSVEERKRVAEIVKDEAGTKIKIIAHIGTLNTRDAVALAQHAEDIKLDALSSIPPIYFKYTFENIYNYYKTVAESTSLPFYMYYIPGSTGISLSNDKIAELGNIKNIKGLKYTATDFYTLQDLLIKMNGKWIAFSGPDEMSLPALTMGVAGSIGSTQNVLPEIFVKIYNNFHAGKIKEAAALQKRITYAVSTLHKFGFPGWKAALQLRGIDSGYCRPPFTTKLPVSKQKELAGLWKKYFPEYYGK
ncbi:MAG: dihydrodipicolinate synthase family protein [Elusimicrobiota bacterium]